MLVRHVEPDVAAPDDLRARGAHGAGHPGGLRVVQDHDVVGPQQRRQLVGGVAERRLVRAPRLVVERQAVAGGSVQAVVDALRDLEERRVAVDHGPARVDAGAAGVADERPQQLRDAAAARGRVDVPDDARAEDLARLLDAGTELGQLRGGEHVGEVLGTDGGDVDVLKHRFSVPYPGSDLSSQKSTRPSRRSVAVISYPDER